MPSAERHAATPAGWTPSLTPPWAVVAIGTAFLAGALLAALVWHTRSPGPADAWAMRWQEVAWIQVGGVATIIASTMKPVVALTTLAGAALAWRVRRWDAVALALVAAPSTLAVEILLKQLVHRQRPGGLDLLYPSGHVAVATAAAVTAVLILRVALVSPRVRAVAAWLAGGFVVVIAGARLVETVHFVTDVVGGAALGVVVTLGMALAITTWWGAGGRPPG